MFEKVNPSHPETLMDKEIWKDVSGYVGHYQISNFGRVKSLKREPFIMKQDTATNGYKMICFWIKNKPKKCLIHRLVATHFIPNPNNLPDVNHIDEDKTNNVSANLEWVTRKYNVNYGDRNRKSSEALKGREPHNRKLTKEDAIEIARHKSLGKKTAAIFRIMGDRISLSMINHFYYGRNNQSLIQGVDIWKNA